MKVQLVYFKSTGKYYTGDEYETTYTQLGDVWKEVREMHSAGRLPGLVDGAGREFFILVNIAGHEHEHPRLILPLERTP